MYRRILVPLDGSKAAESILPYVAELARSYASSIILLQVMEPIHTFKTSILNPDPEINANIKDAEEEQEAQARAYLNKHCAMLRREHIQTRICVARGPVVSTIARIAEYENAELVTMASHARVGLDYLLHSSVATDILHSINRPVMLIHQNS